MVKQKSSEPWKSSFRPKHQEKNIQPTYFSQKAAVTDVPFHKQYLPQHSWTTHTHTHKIIMLKSECVEINAELKKNQQHFGCISKAGTLSHEVLISHWKHSLSFPSFMAIRYHKSKTESVSLVLYYCTRDTAKIWQNF